MRRFFSLSLPTYIKALLAGVSIFFLLYLTVPVFQDYAHIFGGIMKSSFFAINEQGDHIFIDVLLCLFSAGFIAMYTASFYYHRELLQVHRLHRLDYFFTVLGTIMILMLTSLLYIKFRYYPVAHILLFTASFIVILHLWTTTIIRIYTHSLGATIYWKKAFGMLPSRSFLGIFILIAVCLTTSFFVYSCIDFILRIFTVPSSIDTNFIYWVHAFLHSICAPYAVLVMIAIFCRDILRRTVDKKQLAEEKFASERLRAELITNVTHDIRTPLTAIISYVDLIGKLNIDNNELREYLDVLENTTSRLKTLVNDLLEASKASSGNIEMIPESIDLIELIGQVAGNFDDVLDAASITYEGTYMEDSIFIMADGGHLWRVLENLFSNAAKYSLPGTKLYADVRKITDFAELRLRNVSKDKPSTTPEELLQQFVRSEQSRTTEGSGLGLFIAERLTVLMGGTFTLNINGILFEVILTFPCEE
jgi:signal transduction histidine kinase